MFKKIYNIFAMACREATLLMEKKQNGKLDGFEKLALRFHLAICDGCHRYNKQSIFLNELLKKSAITDITDFSKLRLADDAKIRIKQSFDDKSKDN